MFGGLIQLGRLRGQHGGRGGAFFNLLTTHCLLNEWWAGGLVRYAWFDASPGWSGQVFGSLQPRDCWEISICQYRRAKPNILNVSRYFSFINPSLLNTCYVSRSFGMIRKNSCYKHIKMALLTLISLQTEYFSVLSCWLAIMWHLKTSAWVLGNCEWHLYYFTTTYMSFGIKVF